MKRPYGSGRIYEKWGAYYGRWRAPDGRRLNRRLGPKRTSGSADGLTRAVIFSGIWRGCSNACWPAFGAAVDAAGREQSEPVLLHAHDAVDERRPADGGRS